MKRLLKGGRVVDPANGIDGAYDVLIEDGRIARVERNLPVPEGDVQVVEVAPGLVLCPGLIDMHVHVDEAGAEHQTRGHLYDLHIAFGHRQVPLDARDAAVLDEDVVRAVDPVGRVDDPASLKQPFHAPLRPPAGTARPSAPPLRWPPVPESPSTARRPLQMRSRRPGSWAPGA